MENTFNISSFQNYLNNKNNSSSKSKTQINIQHTLELAINDLGLTINTFSKSSITQIKVYTIKIITQRPFSNRSPQQQQNILKSLTLLIDYLRTKLQLNKKQNTSTQINNNNTTNTKKQSITPISIFKTILNKINPQHINKSIPITNYNTITSLLFQLLKIKLLHI